MDEEWRLNKRHASATLSSIRDSRDIRCPINVDIDCGLRLTPHRGDGGIYIQPVISFSPFVFLNLCSLLESLSWMEILRVITFQRHCVPCFMRPLYTSNATCMSCLAFLSRFLFLTLHQPSEIPFQPLSTGRYALCFVFLRCTRHGHATMDGISGCLAAPSRYHEPGQPLSEGYCMMDLTVANMGCGQKRFIKQRMSPQDLNSKLSHE